MGESPKAIQTLLLAEGGIAGWANTVQAYDMHHAHDAGETLEVERRAWSWVPEPDLPPGHMARLHGYVDPLASLQAAELSSVHLLLGSKLPLAVGNANFLISQSFAPLAHPPAPAP